MKSPLRDLDLSKAIDTIVEFLRMNDEGNGYVLGLSGGLDSAVTLALTYKAVGNERVKVLIMPDPGITPEEDVKDALEYAESLKVEYKVVDISPIISTYSSLLPKDEFALGNLRARVRMSLLYYYANHEGRKVVGTGDRSELLIGYFTKYGDGGVDLLPIGGLYKNEVRSLAKMLGVPMRIAGKKSSPRLWPGHMAEEELGLSYDVIDRILVGLFDLKLKPEEVKKRLGLSWEVDKVLQLHKNSAHKRSLPPIPELT
jgi:NAD+ synthase